MRVLLTQPFLPKRQRTIVTIPLGLLYLASYLKKKSGIRAKILDPNLEEGSFYDFINGIAECCPEVIGISTYSHLLGPTTVLIEALKKRLPKALIIIGGSHINAVKEGALNNFPKADYAIFGEGEKGFCEFCRQLSLDGKLSDPGAVNGLVYRRDSLVESVDNFYTQDIAEFDPLDFNLISLDDYFAIGSPMGLFRRGRNVAQIITTRGCPFLCKFCASPINMGKRIRSRPTENIISEIDKLVKAGADEIHIMDDNFTFNKGHVINLCKEIHKRFRINLCMPNGVRLDRLDEDMLVWMKKSGWYHLGFGIEAGSDEALEKIGKAITMAKIKEKIDLIKKIGGFTTAGFFILGFPHDTVDSIRKTASTPDKFGLDMASFGNFTPLPGTELFRELVEVGEVSKDFLPSFASGEVTYSPRGITNSQLAKMQRNITLSYWINPKRIKLILSRLVIKDFIYVFRRLYQLILRPKKA